MHLLVSLPRLISLMHGHELFRKVKFVKVVCSPANMNRGADKSLAQPTYRCLRTETIVSLEANLLPRSNNICLLQTLKYL